MDLASEATAVIVLIIGWMVLIFGLEIISKLNKIIKLLEGGKNAK